MAASDDDIVAEVLRVHGRSFASAAHIRLRNTPAPLFQLLVLALLSSAPIRAGVAVRAARALFDDGLGTPAKMAGATWAHRTRVLNRSGYARYDESTSRYLAATSELVLDRWHGDLRRLRAEADGQADAASALLRAGKGIGPAGAAMFLREVQGVWPELAPFLDDRARAAAGRLGLPTSARRLRNLVDDDETFVRLVAALVRSGLAGDEDAIAGAAS
jgi:hypothetical protein